MRSPSLLPVFLLTLGYISLLTYAAPLDSGVAPMRLYQIKRGCVTEDCRNAIVPPWVYTWTPSQTQPVTPSATFAVATQSPVLDVQAEPSLAPEAGSSEPLSKANAGVALASRDTLLCTVLVGVVVIFLTI